MKTKRTTFKRRGGGKGYASGEARWRSDASIAAQGRKLAHKKRRRALAQA